MKKLILVVAQALVDSPDSVVVDEIKGNYTTVYELRVKDGEVGMVIGKGGATAKAIRQIIQSVASRLKRRAVLEIVE